MTVPEETVSSEPIVNTPVNNDNVPAPVEETKVECGQEISPSVHPPTMKRKFEVYQEHVFELGKMYLFKQYIGFCNIVWDQVCKEG